MTPSVGIMIEGQEGLTWERWPGRASLDTWASLAWLAGRLDLGVGAGWHEGEHRMFGIPFPPRGVLPALGARAEAR